MRKANITHHIECAPEDFAKTVLMPGDPLRAKMIAETFLTDFELINSVRNMLGYTGYYKGRRISVLSSGMGPSSIGTMSHELYNLFGVETIIRVGTAGGIDPNLRVFDLVLAQGACTDSNYGDHFKMPGRLAPVADFDLLCSAAAVCRENHIPSRVGSVLTSGVFWPEGGVAETLLWRKMGVLAVDMETAVLYLNAMRAGKRALSILTISDLLEQGVVTSAFERQEACKDMMRVALEAAIRNETHSNE